MRRTLALIGAISMALAVTHVPAVRAASLQPIGSFDQPIYVTSDPSSPNRLFVVERKGTILLSREGAVSTFANLSSVVSCCEGERGLLSIALAPDFATSGRFYVDYTGKEAPGEIHVAEMQAVANSASIATLRNVLTIPHPGESNHYGGQLQFGPEGLLYISTGDGGGSNDVHHNAQNLGNALGKILRIDPRLSGGQSYTVPVGNPFALAGAPGHTIWSYGLRNPFRFSFDRLSGAIAIGDVGQDALEEVDYAPAPALGAGANYGWSCREGSAAGTTTDPLCSPPPAAGFVEPLFDYPHVDPEGGPERCAIIGGYVVRDQSLGSLYGRYLYGDLCTGEIRSLSLADPYGTDRSEGLKLASLVSFGEDSCGRLYAVSAGGAVERLAGAVPASCSTTLAVAPARKATFVGLRPARRKVERRRKVQVTAWVSPCQGRKGQRVRLLRNGYRFASKRLSVACTAQFLTRIGRTTVLRATIAEDSAYQAAISRRVKIRAVPRQRHRG